MSRIASLRASAARATSASARRASVRSVCEAAIALVERRARRRELLERPLMRCDAVAIELRQRGSRARRLAEAAHVGGGEQQPRVSRLSELVHFDEPGFEIRTRRDRLRPAASSSCLGDGRQLALDLCGVGVELPKLFDLDLPLELQFAQIAEQRPFLRGELIGFPVQRLHALARPRGERLGAGAVVLLGQGTTARQNDDERPQDDERPTRMHGALR